MQQHGFHMAELLVFLFHFLNQLIVLGFDIGNVRTKIDKTIVLIGNIGKRKQEHVHPVKAAIFPLVADFPVPDPGRRMLALHHGQPAVLVIRMMDAFVLTDQLGKGVTTQRQELAVGKGDGAPVIRGQYTVFIDDPSQGAEQGLVEFVLIRIDFDQMQLSPEPVIRQGRKLRQLGFHIDRSPVGLIKKEDNDQQNNGGRHQEQALCFHAETDIGLANNAFHETIRPWFG